MLCVVTGVAGSGKSSLIHGSVAGRDGVVVIDQGAIKGSRRSNPATYTGLLEPIRKAFAKANGVKPALFSSNSEGACPTCNGAGVIFTELGVMATVESPCEECEGKRFQAAVLEYTFGGKNIAEVLAMSVTEAEEFFADGEAKTPAAHKILDRLEDVGLGYLSLGQPLTTLSGGERQRLKLATQMADKGDVYILDEPTTGLHLADVAEPARPARPARRLRQVGDRDRAPPGRDGARRLDHRHGSGCRPRRRHDRLRGHALRARREAVDPHRRAPGGVRRGVSACVGSCSTTTGGRARTSTCGSRRTACCAAGRCQGAARAIPPTTGWRSRWTTTTSTTSTYVDEHKTIADDGTWEEHDRTERRLLFSLHGRDGVRRYALIHTGGNQWLLHLTKEQPNGWAAPRTRSRIYPTCGLARVDARPSVARVGSGGITPTPRRSDANEVLASGPVLRPGPGGGGHCACQRRGPGRRGPEHANSICSFPGLNDVPDDPEEGGRVQSYGQIVAAGGKSFVPSPGELCNGHKFPYPEGFE